MNNTETTNSPGQEKSTPPQDTGFTPWQRLKTKRISYLTLPLLVMATVTEFVILATGWKYQQVVCLPQGMGVTFFGIGPIGATILAVELLKLPLAIWTASRSGWQKGFMITFGLPLICVLTFQLVKDMAVYEMGVAMTPASQMLEKATGEETKIAQLNGELAAIQAKKGEREQKLAELAAKQAKAKADLEDSLKRNDDSHNDAVSLTDYQKTELANVQARQQEIIKQFDADAAQLKQHIAELRSRREGEVAGASAWTASEARIDNIYKNEMAEYENKKSAYEKARIDYDNANFFKRHLMKEPVDPGVPPVRESNTVLKPTALAEIDEEIKAQEAEMQSVNDKRRDRVAQVEADARKMREDYDQRSTAKRAEADKKRDDMLAAQAALSAEFKAERNQIDQDLTSSVQKVDGIRADIDTATKKAEGFYEAREAAIRTTQVHRIATTVEIVRGLIKGERPMSIKASAKERGDILTDQISMVRIWVYPVLAFIVAFLPTLMVEIGFSTLFHADDQRPMHRLGFFGRRLHEVEVRAGRQKMLRADRLAAEATAQISIRDKALGAARLAADKAMAEKESQLKAALTSASAAKANHEEQLKFMAGEYAAQVKVKEDELVTKLATMSDTLNRTVLEKDALRDMQKSEIERQVQLRQNAWSDRITQLRQELDDQRTASETERTALMQEHHKKLMDVTEECKTQVVQARRQVADAELAAIEATAKLTHDLKETAEARDAAEAQLKQQADVFALKLTQAREDGARELEKATRQEKHRFDRQQLEFAKTIRQREEDLEHRVKQREEELSLAYESRLVAEQNRFEQEVRQREAELEQKLEVRAVEVDARWKQELQQREEAAQTRIKLREQQLRVREEELERQAETRVRVVEARLDHTVQQQEELFLSKSRQRDQQWQAKLDTTRAELLAQSQENIRVRETEADARLRELEASLRKEMLQKDEAALAKSKQLEQDLIVKLTAEADARLTQAIQQQEELSQTKSRQRDQQWQVKMDALRTELQAQNQESLRAQGVEADARLREVEVSLCKQMLQKDEIALAKAKQLEEELTVRLTAEADARHAAARFQWESETETRLRATVEPLKKVLARTEQERDEARQSSHEDASRVQKLEKKLSEASAFLNGWRNNGNAAFGAA